jgi:hypothetical protein
MANDLAISLIGAATNWIAHTAAHSYFGNPESFAAAGVTEVGGVVAGAGFIGTYLTLNLDILK